MMDETAVIQNFRKDRHDGREDAKDASTSGVRAVLAQYAAPALREKEEGAWERAAAEKYGKS